MPRAMVNRMNERRGVPRSPVAHGHHAALALSVAVRLIDVSPAGVLLRSSRPARVGVLGTLRLSLDGQPFTCDLTITRLSQVTADGESAYHIGGLFAGMSSDDRRILERFINQQLRRS